MTAAMKTEETLSRREAAEYAGVHYNTIRSWEKRGKLNPERVTINGVEEARVLISELDELIGRRPTAPSGHRQPPRWALGNPEAMLLWQEYNSMIELRAERTETIARLQAENQQLGIRLTECQDEKKGILSDLMKLAGKR